MLTYSFASKDEFVRYLRSRSVENQMRSDSFHERSHKKAEKLEAARVYEAVAAMVERSNLGVV